MMTVASRWNRWRKCHRKKPGEKESGASRGIPDDTDCVFTISVGMLRMLLERLTVFVNVLLKLLSPEALFRPKFTEYRLAAGLCPDPLEELTALPQTPSWI